MQKTYLIIDLATVALPLLLSFHPRWNFYKTWSRLLPALLLTAICFLLWDAAFMRWGVWGFNPQYVMGITIGGLPVEEVLFFICIPYACVFTFHCLKKVVAKRNDEKLTSIITIIIVAILTLTSIFNVHRLYTSVTFISVSVLLLVSQFLFRIPWLLTFYITYVILLLPFLVVNGILTGTALQNPVVWYNENEITGMRILTIPAED